MISPVRRPDQTMAPIGQYGHPTVRFGALPIETEPIAPGAPARQDVPDYAPSLKEEGILG